IDRIQNSYGQPISKVETAGYTARVIVAKARHNLVVRHGVLFGNRCCLITQGGLALIRSFRHGRQRVSGKNAIGNVYRRVTTAFHAVFKPVSYDDNLDRQVWTKSAVCPHGLIHGLKALRKIGGRECLLFLKGKPAFDEIKSVANQEDEVQGTDHPNSTNGVMIVLVERRVMSTSLRSRERRRKCGHE